MTNSQPSPTDKYQKTTRMAPLVSEEADPLRLNPTEENNEEHLEVGLKREEEDFEDIVEEEDFKTEDDKFVVKDLSEKEPILVMNTKVLDEPFESILVLNRNILETSTWSSPRGGDTQISASVVHGERG